MSHVFGPLPQTAARSRECSPPDTRGRSPNHPTDCLNHCWRSHFVFPSNNSERTVRHRESAETPPAPNRKSPRFPLYILLECSLVRDLTERLRRPRDVDAWFTAPFGRARGDGDAITTGYPHRSLTTAGHRVHPPPHSTRDQECGILRNRQSMIPFRTLRFSQ